MHEEGSAAADRDKYSSMRLPEPDLVPLFQLLLVTDEVHGPLALGVQLLQRVWDKHQSIAQRSPVPVKANCMLIYVILPMWIMTCNSSHADMRHGLWVVQALSMSLKQH